MTHKSKAIVIKSMRYSEADLIVKLYTQEHGLLSFLVRGVLKTKKGKLRASFFQIGNQLDVDYIVKNKTTLHNIKEVKPLEHYKDLNTSILKCSLVTFIFEILNQLLVENQEDLSCYSFLEDALNWLDKNNQIALFHHYFLLRLTYFLGFFPTQEVYEYSLVNSNLDFLEFFPLLGINFDELSELKMDKMSRKLLLNKILYYYKLNIPEFKEPKSLEVFEQLFS